MDRIKLYRTFVAVAEETSFTGASRRTGLSSPTVTRAVQLLEEQLGARLFNRNTRVVRLTEAGHRFLADVRRILSDIQEAEASANGAQVLPSGELTITAPTTFGHLHVAPLVAAFLDRHPQLTARALFVDRVVDLIEEGIDVAVRIGHLPDSGLRATQVGELRRLLCASPAYLSSHGVPTQASQLAHLQCVELSPVPVQQQWGFVLDGKSRTFRPPVRLTVNTVDASISAAVAGVGLARYFSYQVAEELRRGRLRVVLAECEPAPVPVHLVSLEGTRASARVRAFVEFASARLRKTASAWSADSRG